MRRKSEPIQCVGRWGTRERVKFLQVVGVTRKSGDLYVVERRFETRWNNVSGVANSILVVESIHLVVVKFNARMKSSLSCNHNV